MDPDPFHRYSDNTGSKGHKLKEMKYQLDLKVIFFTVSVVRHWNRLPREVLDCPSLVIFKTSVIVITQNKALSNVT